MDIQLEKYKLMEWLINLKDESIISKLKNIKNGLSTSSDWADDVSETEKLLVEAGLKDIEEGRTFTHEQVMKEINEAYGL
jgi:predicted transcriptional regulator